MMQPLNKTERMLVWIIVTMTLLVIASQLAGRPTT